MESKSEPYHGSILNGRSHTVILEGDCSEEVPVTSDVPQGSVLGPIFFLIYINDLPDKVNSQVRLFADDTAAYLAKTKLADSEQLQADLDILQVCEITWDMQFNPSKCQVIHITRSRSPLPTKYTLHGETLEEVASARYLGVDIANDLSWKTHISRIINTANNSSGFLRRNLRTQNTSLREMHTRPLSDLSWSMLLQYGAPH